MANDKSKVFTAKELRDTADHIYADYGVARIPISETPLTYKDVRGWEIAAMLHQAADMMEREKKRKKKYEYSYRFLDGDVAADHRENPRMVFGDPVHGRVLVRRTVGEWEEVKET